MKETMCEEVVRSRMGAGSSMVHVRPTFSCHTSPPLTAMVLLCGDNVELGAESRSLGEEWWEGEEMAQTRPTPSEETCRVPRPLRPMSIERSRLRTRFQHFAQQ